jgi:DNA-binding SARP family transcriptional activator
VDFRILGPLDVVDAGRPIELGPPKQRALLAALLVRANQVVSLDRLIDDLWGAEPPPAATGSLQAYVANLRRILEPDRAPRAPAQVLASRAPGYVLQLTGDQLDAARFAGALAIARNQLAAGAARSAYAGLTAALGLWRGPALADVAHWDFAAAEIARLEELRLLGSEAYAEAGLALGRHAEMVAALEALVEQAPLRERVRELLALALYRSQRQADALHLIAATRRLFVTELGIEPGTALRDLQRAILDHDLALDWHPPREVVSAPVADPEPVRTDSLLETDALVGRQQPLSVGLAALDSAAAGRGGLLWLAGEPGIGKTRLAQEVAAAAAGRGFAVGWGRSPDNEGVPAFWPWRQVLQELSSAYPDRFPAASRHAGPDLAPLVSDGQPAPTPAPSVGAAQSAFLACDAASRLLVDLARERPALLLLDDLHWADPPTLQLTGYLASQLARTAILVVATYRDTETGGDGRLAATLAASLREPNTRRLSLTGLDPEGVTQLVAQRVGRPVDPRLAAAIHARTEGNPFFVSEMTRLLVSENRLDQATIDGGGPPQLGVPDSVRDVVRRRIDRLPDQAVTLLTMAAVVGREFDLDVVALISGLDSEAVANAMEAPVLTGLIAESAERPGRYWFTHALIRETAYAGLTGPRRNRLHARTAEAMAARARPGMEEALAHHAWQAGAALDAEQALDLINAATYRAARSFGYEQAVQHVEHALVVLERLPTGPDRDERELTLQGNLGRLLGVTRGQPSAGVVAAFERTRELARILGRPTAYGEAVWGLWSAHCLAARYDQADQLGRELLQLAEADGSPPTTRLAGLQARSAVALRRGDLDTAEALLTEGIAIGEDLLERSSKGDGPRLDERAATLTRSFTVSCHAGQSLVAALRGDAAKATRSRDAALRHARNGGSPVVLAYALYMAAELAVLQRELAVVLDFAGEAVSVSRRYGFSLWAAIGEIFAAWASTLAGEQDGAARVDAALAALDEAGCRMSKTLLLGLLAEVHLSRGRRSAAMRTLTAAEAEVDATGERFFSAGLRALRDQLG